MTNSIIQSLLWTVAIVHVLGQRYVLPYLTAVVQQLYFDITGEEPTQLAVAPVVVAAKPAATAAVKKTPTRTTKSRTRKSPRAVSTVAVA